MMRAALLLIATTGIAVAQPAAVASYMFQNSLAPGLTAVDPRAANRYVTDQVLGQTRTVYEMSSVTPNQNAGLSWTTANVLSATNYSIELVFAVMGGDSTWRRIYDTLNRTSDRGLYLNPTNQFEIARLSRGLATVAVGQYVHLVLAVRDNRIRIYANGVLDIDLATTSMNITAAQGLVHFFLDNTSDTSTADFTTTRIALLRGYASAVTDAEARQLAQNPFGAGPPTFTSAGVRQGATFAETNPIAPGAFFSIFGTGLSAGTSDWTGQFAGTTAPTTLIGTRVYLNDRLAYLSYTSPTQINAIAPDTIAAGDVSVIVERNGIRSTAVTVAARAVNPAFFSFEPRNRRYVAALSADNTAYIAPADLFGSGLAVRPAKPGDFIVAYGMGMGMTRPNVPAGTLPPVRDGGHPLAGTVTLRLGNQPVTPLYAGLSSFAGVYIVGFQVPDLPAGDHELVITVDGVASPSGAMVPVVR